MGPGAMTPPTGGGDGGIDEFGGDARESIFERSQAMFIDLAQSPVSVDALELKRRTEVYAQAIQEHILTTPVKGSRNLEHFGVFFG